MRSGTFATKFQWLDFPISIRVTLQDLVLVLRFFRSQFSRKELIPNRESTANSPGGAAPSETRMKPKRTILCVDDNEQSLSIRKVLLETRGYRVIACTRAEDALECFKKGGIDLVLTDLVMPGFDGTRLVEQIKAISPQTPAILLSGKVRIYDRDTQADVFLPKGMYAPAELLERIRVLLIRKRGPKRNSTPSPNSNVA